MEDDRAGRILQLNMSKTIKEIISEEFLTCSICMKEFQDPKVLKCLHTFCNECIQATIQHQVMTSQSESCPVCRTRIDLDANGDYNLQTNFRVKNLLGIFKRLPTRELFVELYKTQVRCNLSMAHIVTISEANQCVYLQASVDDLRFAVLELRSQIEQYKADLEMKRGITAKLSAQMVTKDNIIDHLQKAVDNLTLKYKAELEKEKAIPAKLSAQVVARDNTIADLERTIDNLTLKAQKEDPEKTVHDLARSSFVFQIVHRCAGFCRCFAR
ncbi:tripartite motif-containing protein 3-like [Ruditapes philippinarum]|uniref:tripartite motif-containing protein 3-like n=1 Tax=Ruditapes philippinarum TaxID=129788 RepID=UPI00295C34CF|nr:tripartite motif-containing protein 3-like [Ruditapes philippinarum]XP_060570959.1 tripartite motif-containing protein 3-like [Ruditapes philippinarum]